MTAIVPRPQPCIRPLSRLWPALSAAGLLATLLACQGGAAPAQPLPAAPLHSALQADGRCDFSGTWAIRFIIPVKWSGNMGVRPGQGNIVQHLKSSRQADGHSLTDALQLCGSEVPDYETTAIAGSEHFGVRFPDSLFDNNNLPGATLRATISAPMPGGSYETELIAIQLGVALDDPRQDIWPHTFRDLHKVVDADNDGNPGITVNFAHTQGYALPPTNFSRTARARQIFSAVRNVASSAGNIVSCDRFEGEAYIPHINGAFAINAHALGCIKENGSHCSGSETALLDRYEPTYAANGVATVVMQRVDAAATCASIRAMAL